ELVVGIVFRVYRERYCLTNARRCIVGSEYNGVGWCRACDIHKKRGNDGISAWEGPNLQLWRISYFEGGIVQTRIVVGDGRNAGGLSYARSRLRNCLDGIRANCLRQCGPRAEYPGASVARS